MHSCGEGVYYVQHYVVYCQFLIDFLMFQFDIGD